MGIEWGIRVVVSIDSWVWEKFDWFRVGKIVLSGDFGIESLGSILYLGGMF